jgi:CheY-like chemotaxis protein
MSAPATSRRVLVVEDNPDGRESMRMVLECWGHRVEVAEDGVQGVQKALTWQPEAAIVDIGLPRLNGFQVAQQVRAALHRSILLIALTGYNSRRDREQAFACGFDVFLHKPADLDELAGLLRREGPNRPQPEHGQPSAHAQHPYGSIVADLQPHLVNRQPAVRRDRLGLGHHASPAGSTSF